MKGHEFGIPKLNPKATKEEIDRAIENDPIYSAVINGYRKQIAYGLGKYTATLGHAGWSLIEYLRHRQQEMFDELNYIEGAIQELEKLEENK